MNPELKRLLWAHISWQRLLLVPAVAFLIWFIISSNYDKNSFSLVVSFYAFAAVWGGFSIIQIVGDDFRSGAWHWQLMLPISPWRLVWGKFLAALILPWLAGLIILLPLLFVVPFEIVLFHIFAALFLNGAAIFSALITIKQRKFNAALALLLAIVLGGSFATLMLIVVGFFDVDGFESGDFISRNVTWYGKRWEMPAFAIVLFVINTGWVLIGAWRLMAKEKQYAPIPFLWILFLLYQILYFNGCMTAEEASFPLTAWFIFLVAFYLSVFLHGNRIDDLRPFIDALIRRDGVASWRTAPPWLAVLPLLLIATIVLYFYRHSPWLAVIFSLFALRDGLLCLIFTLYPKSRLPEGIAVVMLTVLYLILPLALEVFNLNPAFLNPAITEDDAEPLVSTVGALLQVVFLAFLFWRLRLAVFFKKTP